MRLPRTEHTSRPWRIHELTRDFRLEDVWPLPTPGGRDDLERLVSQTVFSDFPRGGPVVVRALWAARWKLGALFGWDREGEGVGSRVATLRDRMPPDLREAPTGPDSPDFPFVPLYQLRDEWAAETANATVHGVIHLSWVPDGTGGYRGQLAVLVRPNGRLGSFYMAAIKPFRYAFVYPAMMRHIRRSWEGRPDQPRP